MPDLPYQLINTTSSLAILWFLIYYFFSLRSKEKTLDEKEKNLETAHRQIIDSSMAKEKQILDSAMTQANQILETTTQQASQIIAGAQYTSQNSKTILDQAIKNMVLELQNISSSTKLTTDQTLQKIIADTHKETLDTSHSFLNNYSYTLKEVTKTSVNDLQIVVKNLEVDLQKQISEFNQTLLPKLEKDVDDYKQLRLKQAEQIINRIIQKASTEIFGKMISFSDHQDIMIKSLEKAKKEGIFD
ncbi:MAG: hypothetical protein V1855_00845 [bacterium]